MLKIFIFAVLFFTATCGKVENDQKVDGLLASLTKEQLLEMDDILAFMTLGTQSEDQNGKDGDSNILQHFLQGDDSSSLISKEDIVSLSRLGLSELDIEEVKELSKVIKVPDELSSMIEGLTDDELENVSEMSPSEIEHFVEEKSLKLKFEHKAAKHKHVIKREAEPEPEPEPLPASIKLPPKLLAGFYNTYPAPHLRGKRSIRGNLRLKLRHKLGFGQERRRRKSRRNQRRRDQRPRPQHISFDLSIDGGRRGGSFGGRRNKHRGQYGGGWRRKREVGSPVKIRDEVDKSAVLPDSTPFLLHSRKRRYVIMDTLMRAIGLKSEQEKRPDLVYMSAVMDGHKHEVGVVENHEGSAAVSHPATNYKAASKVSSTYTPSESYKLALARARMVKMH